MIIIIIITIIREWDECSQEALYGIMNKRQPVPALVLMIPEPNSSIRSGTDLIATTRITNRNESVRKLVTEGFNVVPDTKVVIGRVSIEHLNSIATSHCPRRWMLRNELRSKNDRSAIKLAK